MLSANYKKWQLWFIKYVCCVCVAYPQSQINYEYERVEELEEAFNALENQKSNSFLRKYLTRELFNVIKFRMTYGGNTLLEVIRSGVKNPDSVFGVYAPDPDCYKVFPELMYPIICAAHFLPHIINHPPKIKYGSLDYLDLLDPDGRHSKSLRFELSRNVKEFKFPASMTADELKDSENIISAHFLSFEQPEFRGRYVRLKGMTAHAKKVLTGLHLMFPEQDKYLEDAGGRKHWPSGRGIFVPNSLEFAVWINVEDQIKVVVPNSNGEFKRSYERMIQVHKKIHRRFKFHFDKSLGYLNTSPANIGTGLHCEIEIELPILQEYPGLIQKVCNEYCLAIHGHEGLHSEVKEGETFFLRTTRALGVDEYNAILPAYEGALELLVTEQRLSKELRMSAMGQVETKPSTILKWASIIQIAKQKRKDKEHWLAGDDAGPEA